MPIRKIAVIPARYGSSRFPGKPLALLRGKPLIEHVYNRVRECTSLDGVLVATDDTRIMNTVLNFGGDVVMTSDTHRTGSDRLGEVAENIDADIMVNIQGDEPMIEPRIVEAVLGPMISENRPDIVTAAVDLISEEEYLNPNVVKVVVDGEGRALYFSRSPIPHGWKGDGKGLRHLGIYAYRRESLLRLVSLPQSALEISEGLEQLRALESGMSIVVVEVRGFSGIGVDSPDDLAKAEEMMLSMEEDQDLGPPRGDRGTL